MSLLLVGKLLDQLVLSKSNLTQGFLLIMATQEMGHHKQSGVEHTKPGNEPIAGIQADSQDDRAGQDNE